jgi:LacI family transcriptional regulator
LVTSDIAAPFFAEIASAAEEEAYQHGYHIVICNTRNLVDRELRYLEKLRSRTVDGLIFLTNHAVDERLKDALALSTNVVVVDEDVKGVRVPKVFAENVRGAFEATSHLIEQGHRRIGLITGARGMLSAEERCRGYRTALRRAGLPHDPDLIAFGEYASRHAIESFERLRALANPPSAFFVTSDSMAIEVVKHARSLDLSVPHDFSIVGFDDIPLASLLDPPLTTVRQSTKMLGQIAVRMLLELLHKKRPRIRTERVPVELCLRNSVARPARLKSENSRKKGRAIHTIECQRI